ncbi:MAG: hypothetical protein ACRESS_02590 [Stenotrophobium sp.]
MSDPGIAIAIHLLAVLWWIGGLAFVATVFLPAVRAGLGGDPMQSFQQIEHRFAPQARIAVLITGASGGYLLWRLAAWHWLGNTAYWWLDAMIAFWALFMILLFVLEPTGVLRHMMSIAKNPAQGWRRMHLFHVLMLAVALAIIAGAAAGSHGF